MTRDCTVHVYLSLSVLLYPRPCHIIDWVQVAGSLTCVCSLTSETQLMNIITITSQIKGLWRKGTLDAISRLINIWTLTFQNLCIIFHKMLNVFNYDFLHINVTVILFGWPPIYPSWQLPLDSLSTLSKIEASSKTQALASCQENQTRLANNHLWPMQEDTWEWSKTDTWL